MRVKFDESARAVFLRHLEEFGVVGLAPRAAGISRETANLRCRETLADGSTNPDYDAGFAAAKAEALEHHKEGLYKEACERATVGWRERPVVGKDGEVVGWVLKKSDRLLELLLKRNDPQFRERVDVQQRTEHSGAVGVQGSVALRTVIAEMSEDELDALDLVLRRQQERDATDT